MYIFNLHCTMCVRICIQDWSGRRGWIRIHGSEGLSVSIHRAVDKIHIPIDALLPANIEVAIVWWAMAGDDVVSGRDNGIPRNKHSFWGGPRVGRFEVRARDPSGVGNTGRRNQIPCNS